MAKKKTAKKVAKKAGKASGKSKPAMKASAAKSKGPAKGKTAGSAKSSGKASGGSSLMSVGGPHRITTGSGANAEEVGKSLVEMFNAGKFQQVEDKLWSPAIESIEGMGMGWSGRAAVTEKNEGWMEQNQILGASAEGPYVGATGFAVKFRMHVLEKATGKQTQMEEVGVYTVRDGKIVREEFMYGAAHAVADAR